MDILISVEAGGFDAIVVIEVVAKIAKKPNNDLENISKCVHQ